MASECEDPDWELNTALLNMERDQEDFDVAASFFSRVHTRGAKRTVRKKKREVNKSQWDSDALTVYSDLKEENRSRPSNSCSSDYSDPDNEVQRLPRTRHNQSHRKRNFVGDIPFSAHVARPVSKKEWENDKSGNGWTAYQKEWDNLRNRKVWQNYTVREWSEVAAEARNTGVVVHFGYLFGMMVEKNYELREIDPTDKRIKMKYRVVFRGNDVKDQNYDVALFQDMGSSASTMDASRSADMFGCIKGHVTEQADAEQAYIQAKFPEGVTPTWVVLPETEWLPEWKGQFRRPVVLLEKALYGHPHAGAHWDNHSDAALQELEFEPCGENWPSVYYHRRLKLLLVRYVDDLKLSGSPDSVAEGWRLIRTRKEIGDNEPLGLFLGCKHEPIKVTLNDGHIATGMSYNSEAFLLDCVSL